MKNKEVEIRKLSNKLVKRFKYYIKHPATKVFTQLKRAYIINGMILQIQIMQSQPIIPKGEYRGFIVKPNYKVVT